VKKALVGIFASILLLLASGTPVVCQQQKSKLVETDAYNIFVDFNLSLKEVLTKTKYGYDHDITIKNFSHKNKGRYWVTVRTFYSAFEPVSTEEIKRQFKKYKIEPADLWVLSAIIESGMNFSGHTMIALGSISRKIKGFYYVPAVMSAIESQHHLFLFRLVGDWDGGYCFVGISHKQKSKPQ